MAGITAGSQAALSEVGRAADLTRDTHRMSCVMGTGQGIAGILNNEITPFPLKQGQQVDLIQSLWKPENQDDCNYGLKPPGLR